MGGAVAEGRSETNRKTSKSNEKQRKTKKSIENNGKKFLKTFKTIQNAFKSNGNWPNLFLHPCELWTGGGGRVGGSGKTIQGSKRPHTN